jgi:predicted AAA+ superfamily ATPase
MVEDISVLRQAMANRLLMTTTTFHRYLYDQINWDNRLIGIRGYRGVGKTTLVLQHIKEHFPIDKQSCMPVPTMVGFKHILYMI